MGGLDWRRGYVGPRQSPEEGKGCTEHPEPRGLTSVPHFTGYCPTAEKLELRGHVGQGLWRPPGTDVQTDI